MMTAEELERIALGIADGLEEEHGEDPAEVIRELVVRYRAARIKANNFEKALEAMEHAK